jgi:diguanylate cyclase (GGDEF)-like protein
MDFSEYSSMVQMWIQQILANRGVNAELTLKYSEDIINYGQKTDDCKLMGLGYYYSGETYYGLNDGTFFFETMSKALSYLNQAQEWELMVRCYNFLGIAAMSRGNTPIALDYYLSGLNYCRKYRLQELTVMIEVNLGMLYLECGRYADAQDSLEKADNDNDNEAYIFSIYGNLAQSLILQDKLEQAGELLRRVHTEYWESGELLDHQFIFCVDVLYYHHTGDIEARDASICRLNETLPENLTVLDMFYDYYRCCLVLLEAEQDETFWHIIDVLEPLVENFKIINLHLKIVSLKMKYYRKHGKNAEFLQAAGLFYELSEMMENENRSIVNSVISLRKNLDQVNCAREVAERENQVLHERSELDPLTGIANRFRLNTYSEQVFAQAAEQERSLAVEILDIDYFKEFNDNYGHQEGDRCLVQVADTIQGLVRENHGFCARYGGDEFVIIYDGISREQGISLAAELRRRVLALEIEHRFSKALPIVSISQGMCWGIPRIEDRMWDFLHAADDMLYKVKRFSRNNYCVGDIEESEELVFND